MNDTAPTPSSRFARPHVASPELQACLGAIRAPAVYRNFLIHLVVMIPATVLMCAVALQIDGVMGWSLSLAPALSLAVGVVCLGVGALWVWYVYGYLYLAGGGSPGTHVDGGPARLVDTGPYTVIRHPSVVGKLAGVVGLGLLSASVSFLLIFVPTLLIYSLVTNRFLQERYCEQRFGEAYGRYRTAVPMLVPRPSGLSRWRQAKPAIRAGAVLPGSSDPDQISPELRWYLVGLVALLALSALAWQWVG